VISDLLRDGPYTTRSRGKRNRWGHACEAGLPFVLLCTSPFGLGLPAWAARAFVCLLVGQRAAMRR
jgi:hypothetical protein